MSTAHWCCIAVTVTSAAVSFGFSAAALRGATYTSETGQLYAFSRSLALLIAAVVGLLVGAVPFVAAVAIAMVTVQVGDTVVGVLIKDRLKTVGPAATAVANLAALVWLLQA